MKKFIADCIVDLLPNFIKERVIQRDIPSVKDTGYDRFIEDFMLKQYEGHEVVVACHDGEMKYLHGRLPLFPDRSKAIEVIKEDFSHIADGFTLHKGVVSVTIGRKI